MSKNEESLPKVSVLAGTTKSGFNYTIPQKRLDNYNLLEALGELDTNPLMMAKVVDLLLGTDQKEKLKAHLIDGDGIVSVADMEIEIQEIFEQQNKLKN